VLEVKLPVARSTRGPSDRTAPTDLDGRRSRSRATRLTRGHSRLASSAISAVWRRSDVLGECSVVVHEVCRSDSEMLEGFVVGEIED
jgi:hypothetical protein